MVNVPCLKFRLAVVALRFLTLHLLSQLLRSVVPSCCSLLRFALMLMGAVYSSYYLWMSLTELFVVLTSLFSVSKIVLVLLHR